MKAKMKPRKLLSMLLALVMVVGLLPTAAIPVFAVEESAEQPSVDSEGYILIWSYEQLVSVAKTATKGVRYRLATDIYQTDNTNDLMIWVRNQAYFSLDLNGHVLRSNGSNIVFWVGNGGYLELNDSDPESTHSDFSVKGGIITGGKVPAMGSAFAGGVVVNAGGRFTMNGGRISVNPCSSVCRFSMKLITARSRRAPRPL